MDFVIWTPGYADHSAGIRCLHRLAERLRGAGHTVTQNLANHAYDDQVHVIPDVVYRRNITSRNVVRYALAPPRLHGTGDASFASEPCGFTWLQKYNPELVEFHLDLVDRSIFHERGRLRHQQRLHNTGRNCAPEMPGAVNITKFWPGDRRMLAHMLSVTEQFYNADRESLLNYEARLCGCAVFVPNPAGGWMPFTDELPAETPLAVFTEGIAEKLKVKN